MKNTKIEWAHHTVNFWWGCAMVSLACAYCYAEAMARVFARGRATWGPDGARWLRHQRAAEELMRFDESARKRGVRERVFVNSMSDTFEDRADLNVARDLLWLVACCAPSLDLLMLTKRPENIMRMVPEEWRQQWPANVWVGTTVENQAMADARIPALLQVPAKVRFLSCEPLLGPVEFSNVTNRADCVAQLGKPALAGIHWVICGGESGPKARPMHPYWARSLRNQCAAVGVPFFFKQWGEWTPGENLNRGGRLTTATYGCSRWFYATQTDKQSENCHADDSPDLYWVGKAEAGRLLDGRSHNEFPGGAS